MNRLGWSAWLAGLALALAAGVLHAASVESFSPVGEVKAVRQVAARFSAPMVALGDPRLPAPFDIDCGVAGSGRWADSRDWVYDFERDLPAGQRCTFSVVGGLAALDGDPVVPARFEFSTGGPAIVQSLPFEGGRIDEEQIFILALDAPAQADSVQALAYCDVQGVTERVPVRIIEGEQRRAVLQASGSFIDRLLLAWFKDGRLAFLSGRDAAVGTPLERLLAAPSSNVPLMLLQCQRRLPNNAQVRLVWGSGILSASGVASTQDQALAFKTRDVFEARFSCERANKDAQCLPIMPMTLGFSAPVARTDAQKIVLRAAGGRAIEAQLPELRDSGEFVQQVVFTGPFAERAQYSVELPPKLTDDAGRALVNQRRFPLTVRTDEYPPLAKFPARFGIIELKGDGLLPVTLRNLEGLVESRLLKIGKEDGEQAELESRADIAMNWLKKQLGTAKATGGPVPGSYSRVADGDVAAMIRWMRKLREFEQDRTRWDDKTQQNVSEYRVGAASVFTDQDRVRRLHVPKPYGPRAFEVVGIPLKKPGFYVVELASPRLGEALLGGRGKPYYVQTAALVTNVAVHFKWGRESSLVWVTALDSGTPIARAQVAVQDCAGKVYFRGETDALGRANIGATLPERERLPGCLTQWDRQLVASARVGEDVGLVFSDWNEGISRWRFNLRSDGWNGPFIATTVFDRSLLRAGETVSMKHYYRRHTMSGFSYVPVDQLPKAVLIRHVGSDDKYELPLKWDGRDSAETQWQIPPGARKGTYQVLMVDSLDSRPGHGRSQRLSGTFRVEDFRVPLMKASISGPQAALVNSSALELDLQLRYLSGGAASGAPVTLRGIVRPRPVSFPGYDGFSFANGGVEPGIERNESMRWTIGQYELAEADAEAEPALPEGVHAVRTQALTLDASGGARAAISGLSAAKTPQELVAEMEYSDPNGERLTAATRVPLWPSRLLLGVKPDSWAMSAEALKFQVVVLDLAGKPVAGTKVQAALFLRQPFAHRKRLIGGFYGYESGAEISRLPVACEGVSDARGRVFCNVKPGVSGNVFMVAQATDADGNVALANASAWVAGKDGWWFDATDDDRMDVVPESKRYEPGQRARLQVRMPFRSATALVTVEREGVIDSFVRTLSADKPVIELPIRNNYAPNVFVSVLAVRGRIDEVKPTALIDLGKPAFKMGVAELQVGWRAHELKVSVKPDKALYRVRDTARVALRVTRALGGRPVKGTEVAIAAVDEGLLELLPNDSWQLLATMMNPRGIEVDTATASMQVVGKRHYGRKALPAGGGGGRESARELFDTLLAWKARVTLDDKGSATVDIPLNDSLTAFRIVAVADAGSGLFGTGSASIRTSQDLQLLSGLPAQVREGDRFEARFTARNASARDMVVEVGGSVAGRPLPAQRLPLAPGAGAEAGWEVQVPAGLSSLDWDVTATELRSDGPLRGDHLRVTQRVTEAVPVRTLQATISQLAGAPLSLPVAAPAGALPGRGGLRVEIKPKLGDELPGVRDYMQRYPYTCLEQQISRAIALQDEAGWARLMDALPSYLDRDGLARYFAQQPEGSDTLSAYLLAIADEAGWVIPETAKGRLIGGLRGFVEGRVLRDSALPTADLAIRKIAALSAISRSQPVDESLLSSFTIEPNLWPTSALIDWYGLLRRSAFAERDKWLAQAEQILRSRLNFQGTTMGFSTERNDYLWWLMVSGDVNANRVLLAFVDDERWREEVPRLVRGTLGRQQQGRWNTTVANAWGVLAMRKFSSRFEREPVTGMTSARLDGSTASIDWLRNADGGNIDLGWPAQTAPLELAHSGTGRPWVTVQSRAALPLEQPLSSGFSVRRSVSVIEARSPGHVSRGDTIRVRLELEAQSDMAWVVVDDPVPAGATILGRGLGGDSQILGAGETRRGFVWPAFEERTFEAFRAYYRFVPKGSWVVEYTMRVNNAGRFELPPTRVEAMYAPEMFAMLPNPAVVVER